MLNMQIRRMIDEIFADMKMTAENLALRDELMANAQERFEDSVRRGQTEEEAFAEVVSSLGDVQSLLKDMNEGEGKQPEKAAKPEEKPEETAKPEEKPEAPAEEAAEEPEEPAKAEKPEAAEAAEKAGAAESSENAGQAADGKGCPDLEKALNRAFSALGDIGRQIVPQAKKIVDQVDEATDGLITGIGKAVNKGVRGAQKAASEAMDKRNREQAAKKAEKPEPEVQPQPETPRADPKALREEAEDLRAQLLLKRASGDEATANEMEFKAAALIAQAEAIEQEIEMDKARAAAEANASRVEDNYVGADGELDETAFSKAVEDMTREAEETARTAENAAEDAEYTVKNADSVHHSTAGAFPAAGLRSVSISLDADDVVVQPGNGTQVEVLWEADVNCPEPAISMDGHTLTIKKQNPDVFKTFFSVFKKEGGKVTVRVPRGYAADYTIGTTSGDIRVYGIDVDNVKVNTTSGDVRLEPDAAVRGKDIAVSTVSGDVTVSACAESAAVNTVSGEQFISCDVNRVDVNVVSGKVHVEGACDEWDISTVSADVVLLCTVSPTRKIQTGSMSGSVRIALPADIRGFVADLSSMSGKIVNEFGPDRYGTCALPIHMDSVSGSLMITRL